MHSYYKVPSKQCYYKDGNLEGEYKEWRAGNYIDIEDYEEDIEDYEEDIEDYKEDIGRFNFSIKKFLNKDK